MQFAAENLLSHSFQTPQRRGYKSGSLKVSPCDTSPVRYPF